MKTPVDEVLGTIVDVSPGRVLIEAPYDDVHTLCKREYRKCRVIFLDSRPLSEKQRRACYALLREIAEFSGMTEGTTKQYMKLKFLADDLQQTAEELFSLADAPMSLVCAFQKFLVRFILEWDIPCRFPLLKFVDDIADYVYGCMIHKKCCVCGRPAELHHVDHVGMGRDRREIVREGLEAMPLCREHHSEAHTLGQRSFNEKYHFDGGVVLDKTLCRIYGLKKEKNHAE